jgi:NAD-dependent SIR2 family protein deacetylase
VLEVLARTPRHLPEQPDFVHGRLKHYGPDKVLFPVRCRHRAFQGPNVTWSSALPPRGSGAGPAWLTASELEDREEVLQDKVRYLAKLVRCSRRTVLYTGAGSSTGAGVRQAARGPAGPAAHTTEAHPTPVHRGLGLLSGAGLVHTWVQLNYDGLAQKAGCPQEALLEVHGSWFDPSNPVVKPRGQVRDDLFQAAAQAAEEADLCLALGTSLRGAALDSVARLPAERSLVGRALGTIIVSRQQTPEDGTATLRIFCSLHRLLTLLLRALDLGPPAADQERALSQRVRHLARVPYDERGWRSNTVTTVLNLTPGEVVRLHESHNWAGCGQERGPRVGAGEGRVLRYCSTQRAWELEVGGAAVLLGMWWLEAAARGAVPFLPVVSARPEVQPVGPS